LFAELSYIIAWASKLNVNWKHAQIETIKAVGSLFPVLQSGMMAPAADSLVNFSRWQSVRSTFTKHA